MADIFISYASEDRSRAEPIAKALEEYGWSVWWDRTIPPGKTFDQVIEEAINAARCVVVLWSRKSIKSDWVKEEANIGKERKILVPAKIDPVDLPLGFGRIQAADLTNWEAEKEHPGFFSLQNAISEVAGPPPERDKSEPDTKLPESNMEQQVKLKSEESETFQPDPSHLKPDAKESPITGPKAPRKIRLAFGIGAVALILVLSIIGWFLFSKHTITAKAGNGGSISPSGPVSVSYFSNKKFTIKPDSGYRIEDVKVDGISVGAKSTHAIENVTNDRTISAIFAVTKYTIYASSGTNGSISPSDEVEVTHGSSETFTITPDPCYRIADIKVDNRSIGVESSYPFKDITRNHTIEASFSINPPLAAPENLALNKLAKASESSTRHTGADRAIDGKTDGNFKNGSVTHTQPEPNSWWRVELPSPAMIERIVIWNRTDACCRKRLSNLRISVLNDSEEKIWSKDFRGPIRDGDFQLFKVDPPKMGRFVKVEILGRNLENNGILSLAEVEVFGKFCK